MYVVSQPRQNQWHPQKDAFADSLIPYYLQAKELGELTLFFRAANHLLLDRFPPPAKRQHGVTKLSAMNKMKRVSLSIVQRFLSLTQFHRAWL